MKIPIRTICDLAIDELKAESYQESTIKSYTRTLRQLAMFAEKYHEPLYTVELGELFRSDVRGEKTEQICKCSRMMRCRCVDILNNYLDHGSFDLRSCRRQGHEQPRTKEFCQIHVRYLNNLALEGKHQYTIDSFRNVTCKYLRHLETAGVETLASASVESFRSFISELRETWAAGSVRTALSALRSFYRYVGCEELLKATDRTRSIREHKIVPVLSDEEEQRLWDLLDSGENVTKRDKAIFILSMLTGLRACDIVALRTKNIDWCMNAISICQQKTGNPLAIPMVPMLGNAIAEYMLYERPKANTDVLFLKKNAPFGPLCGHTSCYAIIKRTFEKAGVSTDARICGTRLMRHNAASKMLRSETPIETISALLGHANPTSTEVYLSTDEIRMCECCLPIPFHDGESEVVK